MRPTRPMWTNATEANANKTNASKANEANEANANLADNKEVNANKTNDGLLPHNNFIIFRIALIVCVLLISLTKYCETLAEVRECFGIVECDNKL